MVCTVQDIRVQCVLGEKTICRQYVGEESSKHVIDYKNDIFLYYSEVPKMRKDWHDNNSNSYTFVKRTSYFIKTNNIVSLNLLKINFFSRC